MAGNTYSIASITPTVCKILGIRAPVSNSSPPIIELFNKTGRQQRICLILIDSFGIRLWEYHRQATPNINTLAEKGMIILRAESPPYTPVNIASIATGTPFSTHRVRKKDDQIITETILDVMLRCSLKTSIISDEKSAIYNLFPGKFTYMHGIVPDNEESISESANNCIHLEHPDFIWIHFLNPDIIMHKFGPQSPECRKTMADTDFIIGKLVRILTAKYYGILLTGDHGQHENIDASSGMKGIHDGTDEADFPVPLIWKIP